MSITNFGENYKAGSWNVLPDTNIISGDPRRSHAIKQINKALEEVYSKNCLENVDEVVGAVAHVLSDRSYPSAEVKSSQQDLTDDANAMSVPYAVYRVYIPELYCLKAPQFADDPVLATYPEVRASENLMHAPGVGSIVRVRYDNFEELQGPAVVAVVGALPGGLLPALRASLPVSFAGGSAGLLGGGECAHVDGEELEAIRRRQTKAVQLQFTFDELRRLQPILGPPLQPLMDAIGKHESGPCPRCYYRVNRGCAGDTKLVKDRNGDKVLLPDINKKLTELTIGEIIEYQKPYKRRGGSKRRLAGKGGACPPDQPEGPGQYGLLAVGKYQWIPKTLQGEVSRLAGSGEGRTRLLNTRFTKDVQEAMGLSLLMLKRPWLGAYLMGRHNDVCSAAQSAALEWASIPVQYRYKKCSRGFSAYCTGGANATRPLGRKPEEITGWLTSARNAIQNDSRAMQVLRSKGYA